MTYDSDSRTGQAYLTDALLWIAGAPLALLDAAYLAYAAPPITPSAPETLVVWVLALVGLALLAWGLLSSALAHLATLRLAPAGLRRATRFLVTRFGTSLSRSLLARAGASALIGSAMLTAAPIGAAVSMADPMRALAPARARRERDRLVPNRVTRNLVALRRPAGASRRVARCARAEDRRPQANSARPTRARTHTTSVSGALGVIGGAA